MPQRPITAQAVGLLKSRPAIVSPDISPDISPHSSRYMRATVAWTLMLYGFLAAAMAGVVSPLWLLLAVPMIYPRLALALHELMHLRTPDQVTAFHRLTMIFDTPLGLGYTEHRVIHLQHHRSSAGHDDPELYQISGGHGRALLGAMLVPERSLVNWVRAHGFSHSLLQGMALRCLVFCTVAAIAPTVFVVYWLALRISIGACGFVFHHLLHQRAGRLGTFSLAVNPAVLATGRWLFGEEPMLILQRHRAHHLWPGLRVHQLPDLPADFALPPGRPDAGVRALATQASRAGAQR